MWAPKSKMCDASYFYRCEKLSRSRKVSTDLKSIMHVVQTSKFKIWITNWMTKNSRLQKHLNEIFRTAMTFISKGFNAEVFVTLWQRYGGGFFCQWQVEQVFPIRTNSLFPYCRCFFNTVILTPLFYPKAEFASYNLKIYRMLPRS